MAAFASAAEVTETMTSVAVDPGEAHFPELHPSPQLDGPPARGGETTPRPASVSRPLSCPVSSCRPSGPSPGNRLSSATNRLRAEDPAQMANSASEGERPQGRHRSRHAVPAELHAAVGRETKVGAVVDPGGDLDAIEAAIAKIGMTVEKILLTHGHIDHAGGADELRAALGVPHRGPAHGRPVPARQPRGAGRERTAFRRGAVTPDRWLEEGDTVTVAGATFDVLHCPGHSPGSVVMVNAAQRFALMGDVLFRGSIGRTDFPYGDHDALIDAIKTKLLPLGDDIAFICGTGR